MLLIDMLMEIKKTENYYHVPENAKKHVESILLEAYGSVKSFIDKLNENEYEIIFRPNSINPLEALGETVEFNINANWYIEECKGHTWPQSIDVLKITCTR